MVRKMMFLSALTAVTLTAKLPATVQEKGDTPTYTQESLPHLFPYEYNSFEQAYKKLPASVHHFEKLGFDARMEQQEFLRLKSQDTFFITTLCNMLLKEKEASWSDSVSMAMEIVELGQPLATIPPTLSMKEIADRCGLKRVSDLINFKNEKKNHQKFFLDGKSNFEKSALIAELQAFNRASSLFNAEEWMTLNRTVLFEEWHYNKQNPNVKSDAYQKHIIQKASSRLKTEQIKRKLVLRTK